MDQTLETVKTEFDAETGVGHLVLQRPDALNALNEQLRSDIVAGLRALNEHNQDEINMRVVVMEGTGDNFCAGADIGEFEAGPSGVETDRTHYQFVTDYPLPVIAKIRGYCLGGGLETALSSDFRFVAADAQLGLPEVDLGIIPGAGGVQLVSRLANPSVAKELAMTGNYISGERAAELGIANEAHSDANLDDAVAAFAETLASKPPLAIQAIKQSADMATEAGLQEGREYDRKQVDPLFATEDHAEGARAFEEDDYEPEFRGK